jgi:peroxiredoxin
MSSHSRRILPFAASMIGAVGLLAILLMLFARPPRSVSVREPATPTPHIIATVDSEGILLSEWEQAVAVDQVMSLLVGQRPPSPEETLSRLINERLVLKAARAEGLPEANRSDAEAWLRGFLTMWNVEEAALEQALAQEGLSRGELTDEIIPRLLQVQEALEKLAPSGGSEDWISDLRKEARVQILENLTLSTSLASSSATPRAPVDTAADPVSSSGNSTYPRIGDLAPGFTLENLAGTPVHLTDYRGRPVLLNFWAAWCTPCQDELLMLQDLGAEELAILSIAVREPAATARPVAEELAVEHPLLLDKSGKISDLYRVRGLPASLFLDRQGLIVARHVGPLDKAALDHYLSLLATPANPTPSP